MSCVTLLLNFLKDYQNTSVELKKCSYFSKRSIQMKNKDDLISAVKPNLNECNLKKELNDLIEALTVSMDIMTSSYSIDSNRISIKLFRPSFIKLMFVDILNNECIFGTTNCHHGKVFRITFSDSEHQLTNVRMEKVAKLLSSLITIGGGSLVNNNEKSDFKVLHLTNSSTKNSSLLVCPVKTNSTNDMSKKEFIQLRTKDIQFLSSHKSLTENAVMQLADAFLVFDMLSTKIEKILYLDLADQPKDNRQLSSKGASFVLYNYVRLCSILETFEKKVSEGIYQPLPSVTDTNYTLLDGEDEWSLVFDILAEWPTIVLECQDFRHPKLHRITGFLSLLASRFSVYYRHTRILNEGFAHMFPLMEARLQLLLAVKQVFIIALNILGIIPPKTM